MAPHQGHRRTSWQLRAAQRYGWRGVYLQAIGAGWVLIGVAVAVAPSETRPWVLFDFVPAWLRAVAWVGTGAVAITVGRRHPLDDSAGHVALYLVPAVRCASYAVSWVAWAITKAGHDVFHKGVEVTGWEPALFPAAVWVAVLILLSICARWPNPTPLPHPPRNSEPTDRRDSG